MSEEKRRPRARAYALAPFLGLALWVGPGIPTDARAGLVMALQPSSARAGEVGNLSVTLTNMDDGSGATYRINAFEFGLSLAPQAGIQFRGIDRDTRPGGFEYIFLPPGPGDLSYSPFPGSDLIAIDSAFNTAANARELALGETVGLGHVTYFVPPGASADASFSVAFDPLTTGLNDPDGQPIGFRVEGGIITISSVPEPSTFVLAVVGTSLMGACVLKRGRTEIQMSVPLRRERRRPTPACPKTPPNEVLGLVQFPFGNAHLTSSCNDGLRSVKGGGPYPGPPLGNVVSGSSAMASVAGSWPFERLTVRLSDHRVGTAIAHFPETTSPPGGHDHGQASAA